MEGQKIIQIVTDLFNGTDERDWQKVQNTMAAEVMLDYTSMIGGDPGLKKPEEIVKTWACFLPGFDSTNHQLSEFRVKLHGTEADVNYVGKADHFLDGEVWTLTGTYETKLQKRDGAWKVTYLKLNYDKQTGNTALPARAKQKMAAVMQPQQ